MRTVQSSVMRERARGSVRWLGVAQGVAWHRERRCSVGGGDARNTGGALTGPGPCIGKWDPEEPDLR